MSWRKRWSRIWCGAELFDRSVAYGAGSSLTSVACPPVIRVSSLAVVGKASRIQTAMLNGREVPSMSWA
jgi:hypothetical protein